jgi:hypothetical protein
MRLYGYRGASSEENHDRHYLDADLSHYVEVPRSAILHRMAVPAEQDPNGAVVLWVRRDAALIYKSAPAAQALANYFAGAIAGAAAAAPGIPAAPFLAHTGLPCGWTFRCPPVTRNLLECTPLCHTPVLSIAEPCAAAAGAAAMPAAGAAAAPLLLNSFALCAHTLQVSACVVCTLVPPCRTQHTCAACYTLVAAGGAACTPDCQTGRDICGFQAAAAGAAAMPADTMGWGCQAGVAAMAAAAPQAAALAPAGQLPIGLHTRAIISCLYPCPSQICRTPQPTPCPGCF